MASRQAYGVNDLDSCGGIRLTTKKRGRRRLLGSVVAAWLSRPAILRAAPPTKNVVSFRETLTAVVDTIVPRDRDPGAVDVGVVDALLSKLARDADGQRLYRQGCTLVEEAAHAGGAASFRSLDADGRERIFLSTARGTPESMNRRFFERARHDVLSLYWSTETAQRVVGYRPPRGGYPEYADPPRERPR